MIVWDLGGVVARFEPEHRLDALAETTGLDRDRIHEAVWGSGLDAAAERGAIDEPECWSRVLAALDHRVNSDTVRRCWAAAFVPDADVLAYVDASASPRALFTDNGPVLEHCLRHELDDIGRRFTPWLLSWRLQAVKNQPDAFRRAATRLRADPHDLTLVDDRAANVDAATRAGWNTLQFTSVADLDTLH